jgi:very-short-patch-repair endonuclease
VGQQGSRLGNSFKSFSGFVLSPSPSSPPIQGGEIWGIAVSSLPLDGGGAGGGDPNLVKHMNSMARTLRKNLTDSERRLWRYLRAKQVEGLRFRRQEPIGSYIVDFVCFEKRLIIEVDGGQHAQEKHKDEVRDRWLREQGFQVLRFWDNEVMANIQEVLGLITESSTPSRNPSRQERGRR